MVHFPATQMPAGENTSVMQVLVYSRGQLSLIPWSTARYGIQGIDATEITLQCI